ncbi:MULTISPECIES: tRNA adenosine(34) deaminase TadA [Corallincola]|uniref:tRNA-specific adenosine deaminase n=3 Tax=Corallincola TaxID=1775176 RepID=A0A368N525_9GAMM|nr:MULTISPECIES: tRNA adenosine(34) deaminase TadA [Corallincola]RCU44615.1 tRNA adenosine(34) deaminase TadA [Corallincola holothuriorum]TAA40360.1 tRNA adenosine(34) deaminase TadA [Corallincola spongiicola]TCI05328.1 tRNA adenosine(34) deaminase TadA [Corallincola luteus]
MSEISNEIHEKFMRRALALAAHAEALGEVPVGAVVVYRGEVIAEGWNQQILNNDPTAHAEVMALQAAGRAIGNYRLLDTQLYVTLEPCVMCAGAMVHGRVGQLIFGAADLKTGAAGSIMDITRHGNLNHQIEVVAGVLAGECSEQLSGFFRKRRAAKRAEKLARQQQSAAD